MRLPNKKYKIIYADPPWSYRNMGNIQATAQAQYNTMKQEDIEIWLNNRLHPGHHFNSQLLIDFNKEAIKLIIEEIEKFEWDRVRLDDGSEIPMFDKWKLILFLKSKITGGE